MTKSVRMECTECKWSNYRKRSNPGFEGPCSRCGAPVRQSESHGDRNLVDATPFREMVLERIAAGTTWSELAVKAGLAENGRRATTQLQRQLGLVADTSRGKHSYRQGMRYETAAKIARALDRDPVDFDI